MTEDELGVRVLGTIQMFLALGVPQDRVSVDVVDLDPETRALEVTMSAGDAPLTVRVAETDATRLEVEVFVHALVAGYNTWGEKRRVENFQKFRDLDGYREVLATLGGDHGD